MALSIAQKEFEDIKLHLENTVSTFLGYREPSIVKILMHCLSSRYDKCKTAGKLESPLLDLDKALFLTEKAFDLAKSMTVKVDNVHITNKRSNNFENDENIIKRKKVSAIFKEEVHSFEQVKNINCIEKLQNEIPQRARNTDISSVTKTVLSVSKEEQLAKHFPNFECRDNIIFDAEPLKSVSTPVFLTKESIQNRCETSKEEQEKLPLGLESPVKHKDQYELDKKIEFEKKMGEGITRLLSVCSDQQTQSLQAAKSLLTSNKRMTSYLSELRGTSTESTPQVSCDDVGGKTRLSLSDLRFPLMWRDTDYFKNKGDYRRFAAFCLAKIGTQLYDTNITFPVDRSMTDVTFNDVLIFENISTDFELELELYAHVLRNDFSIASSPKKIKNTLHSSMSTVGKKLVATLRDESNSNKIQTNFKLMGSAKLSIEEVSSRVHAYDMQIENTETRNDQLPLYGIFCCRLAARPYCTSTIVYSGCVWLKDEFSSSWASLRAFELSIWSTAENAKYQPPLKIFKIYKNTEIRALKTKNEIEISNKSEKRIVSLTFSVENDNEKNKWLKYLVQHTKDYYKYL